MGTFMQQPSSPPSGAKTLGALVMILILFGATYYGLSYISARSLKIEIVDIYRSYNLGLLGYFQFDTKVRISSSGLLDTTLSQVTFGLVADIVSFPAVQGQGTTFSIGNSLEYTLRFTNINSQDASYLSQKTAHKIAVSITTWVSSGIYSGWVTASYEHTYQWS